MQDDRVPDLDEESVSIDADHTELVTYMAIATTYDGHRIPWNNNKDIFHA